MKTGSFPGGFLIGLQAVCLVALLAAAGAASGASTNLSVRYEVVQIPGLPGHDWSELAGINDLGQLVGASGISSTGLRTGFVWDKGVATPLTAAGGKSMEPTGINRSGQIAGYYQDGPRLLAAVYDHGAVTELPALPNFTNTAAMPLAINDAGVVAGSSVLTNQSRAVFWSNGVLSILAGLPGTGASWAQAINVWGNTAGAAQSNTSAMASGRAVAWENGRVWDLGTLPGGSVSSASALNDYGQVAGVSDGPDAGSRPFYFTEGQRYDIGLLPGMVRGSAAAMNNMSQVVGAMEDIRDNSRAFLYRGGQLEDLNALIPTNSGWTLSEAVGINDRGQIIGSGYFGGRWQGFLLNPEGLSSNGLAPSVSVLSPTNGMRMQPGSSVVLAARVSDPDDRVFLVEFFVDGEKVGWRTNRPLDTRFSSAPFVMTWSNAPLGVHAVTMRATDHCGLSATSAPSYVTIAAPLTRELHIVSVYQPSDGAGGVPVHVDRPDKRVTLFLSSAMTARWSVTAGAGTVLESVILGGVHTQMVAALPAGVTVRYTSEEGGSPVIPWISPSLDSPAFYHSAPLVRSLAGQEITSFQGFPNGPLPDPIRVESVQEDPRLRSDYPVPVPSSQWPVSGLSFSLWFYRAGAAGGPGVVYERPFTLNGSPGSPRLLPADSRVVPGGDGRWFYGTGQQSVFKVDSQTGVATDITPLAPELDMSWPTGVAFDSARGRVVLSSLGGEGFLYAYSPPSNLWSVISSLNNFDSSCLEYHPGRDSLAAVSTVSFGGGLPRLREVSSTGQARSEFELPLLTFGFSTGDHRAVLAAAGGYYVLLAGPAAPYWGEAASAESRIYLIDPRTGQSWLTYRTSALPPTNRPPLVSLTAPATGTLYWSGQGAVELEASAQDPDGSVLYVEFLAGGRVLGRAAGDQNIFRMTWTNPPAGWSDLTARAVDSEGAAAVSTPVSVRVIPPEPVVIQGPAPQTVTAGQSASMSVQAEGAPPLSFQWQKNGVDVPNGAGSALEFSPALPGDAGDYRVLIQNSYGRATSAVARLVVAVPAPGTAPAPGDQVTPAVASSERLSLVVWTDSRAGSGGETYAARVTFDGVVLDPGGILISANPYGQWHPAVASDGRDFLVVWQATRAFDVPSGQTPSGFSSDVDIYGARVTAEGVVLDSDAFPVSQAPSTQERPSVAFNGTNYLVVWTDARLATNLNRGLDIYGARISPAGQVLDPGGLAVYSWEKNQSGARVTAWAGRFYVAWTDARASINDAYWARVDNDGTVYGSSLAGPFNGGLAMAANETGVLVAGADSRGYKQSRWNIYGTRIPLSGGGGSPLVLSDAFEDQTEPAAAASGSQFLTVWTDKRLGDSTGRIYGGRVNPSGVVESNGFVIVSGAAHPAYGQPAAAGIPGGYCVVWTSMESGAVSGADIRMTWVDLAGNVLDGAGVLVTAVPVALPEVVWNQPEGIEYGTPLSELELNASCEAPGSFVYNPPAGTVLEAGWHTLSVEFIPDDLARYAPALASVPLAVRQAPLRITADNTNKYQGQLNPVFTVTAQGLVNGDTPDLWIDADLAQCSATDETLPGRYPIFVQELDLWNYDVSPHHGVLTILPPRTQAGSVALGFNGRVMGGSVRSLAFEEGGVMIAGGDFTGIGGMTRNGVARLLSDQTVDPSFNPPASPRWVVARLACQPDGRLLVAGNWLDAQPGGNVARPLLERLLPNGAPDPEFDKTAHGLRTVDALALQPDGKIVVVGDAPYGCCAQLVVRLLPSGLRDPAFNSLAQVEGEVYGLAIQADGGILVAGSFVTVNGVTCAGLGRLMPDGSLDMGFETAFGSSGVVALALQPDGRILAGLGRTRPDEMGQVVRLASNGTWDDTFQSPLVDAGVQALAVQPDGRILIGGSFTTAGGVPRAGMARLLADGRLDPAFDPAEGFEGDDMDVKVVAAGPDGAVWAGGHFETVGRVPRNGLVRLHGSETGPYIDSVSPGAGAPGIEVVLMGGGFSETPGANVVWFGAARATVLIAQPGMLRVSVPTGAVNGPVTVAVGGRVAWAPRPFAVTYSGNGAFDTNSLAPRATLPAHDRTTPRVVLGDVDGDGRLDMVVAVEGMDAGYGSVAVYRNIGVTGSLDPSSFALAWELPAGVRTLSVALADLDGDGKLDIIATDVDASVAQVWVWVNYSEPGRVYFAPPFALQSGLSPSSVAVNDFNRDGRPDLAVANGGAATVSLFEGLGAGGQLSAASFAAPVSFPVGVGPSWVAAADLDGDGWADLVAVNHNGESVSVLRNTGLGGALSAASFAPQVIFPAGNKPMVATVGDLDGDGKPDLAVAAYGEGNISLLRNTSQAGGIDADSFGPRIALSFGGPPHMAAIADIDGDDRPDLLVVGEYQDTLSVWRNTGASPLSYETFVPAAEFPAGHNSSCVAVGDLDGDGRPDVAVANDYSYNVSIYRNRVPQPGPAAVARAPLARTVFGGRRASFEVVAQGTAPLAFQWSFNNVPIPGATGAVLTLPQARTADQGDYRVRVANSLGSAESSPARLTVMPVPSGAGSLDVSFDPSAGGQKPPWNAYSEYEATHVVPLPDGRVLVAGDFISYQGVPCHGLVRLNADGSLDRPFALTSLDCLEVRVNALALAPDGGRMLVAYQAWHQSPGYQFWNTQRLLLLNPDGGQVPGWSWTDEYEEGWIHSLAYLPDGKILIGGDFIHNLGGESLARLYANGEQDFTFGGQSIAWDPAYANDVTSLLVQPDGRALFSGHFRITNPAREGLARVEALGALDTSFTPALPVGATVPNALVLQPDGKILVAQAIDQWTGRWGLARFLPDGRLDPAFSSQALSLRCNAVALLADQTLLAAPEGWQGIELSRFNADGTLKQTWPLDMTPSGFSMIKCLAVQPGGRVLAGGVFDTVRGYPVMPVARFNTGWAPPVVTRTLPAFYRAKAPARVELQANPDESVMVYAIEEQPPAGWLVTEITSGGAYDARTGKVKFGPYYDSTPRQVAYTVTPPAGTHGVVLFAGTVALDGRQAPVGGAEELPEARTHPADRAPEDGSLGISEVTAYGAAWRRGDPWLVEPSPIPIDYVTRAAMLWRQGECYELDDAAAAPMCWVPCGAVEGGLPIALSAGPAALSRLPAAYTPLAPVTVSITAQPAEDAASYAVEDRCPAGWAASAISDGGQFDAGQGLVKWGPFFDARPRTLSYQATPPAGARGIAAFAGRVSIDGASALVAGARQIAPAVRLTLRAAPGAAGFQIDAGAATGSIQIESSTDLIHWTPVMTLADPTGWIALPPPAASETARFYRARAE